ncbi:coil containing protein [Vibrio phage 1.232.O._10N.261.51.E11]|nr:coil containing protein [Vibrio phage 1.232.O._10N.261.51.E11]
MTTSTQVTTAAKTDVTTMETALKLKGRKAIDFFCNEENVQPLVDFVISEADALVPDVTTDKGRKAIGSNASAISKSRKLLEEAIGNATKDAQEVVNRGKAVKKSVVAQLNDKRTKVLQPRVEWQEEQDRIEQERVDDIRERITNIGNLATLQGTESKEELAGIIDALEAMDVSEGFEEFTQEAMKVKQEAIGTIHTAVNALVQKELDEQARIEREQEQVELEAERKQVEITGRIQKLQQIPMTMFQSTAEEVSDKIHSLNTHQPTVEDFEDRHGEAMTAFNGVIANLNMLLQQKQQAEEAQRIIDEAEEKKLAEEAAAQEPVQEPVQEPQPSDTLERLPEEDNAPFLMDEEEAEAFNDVIADAKPEPQEPQPTQFELAQSDLIVLAGITGEQAAQVIKQIQQSNVRGLYANF